jgi:exodeoxyribonuclease VII large subunit
MAGQGELPLGSASAGVISVSQLVRAVREALELTLTDFWVVGEVSNHRLASSNHLYFTLKDDGGAINVVMFRSVRRRLRFQLSDGMEVIVRGRVSIYEPRGALQFYAEEIEPRGIGALQLAFTQLKERLARAGLFDAARKRALPFLPRTVGIVTALGGAGLQDMLTIILGRFENLHVIVRPAKVQGDSAAFEIAQAIDDLNRDGRSEVIIVGRGGGSLEDLWAFNEEGVALAIANSSIPIVSAVGHEIDYTIADFVADLRAPTPTAAAQMVVPDKAEIRARLTTLMARMTRAIAQLIDGKREEIDRVEERLGDPMALVLEMRKRLDGARSEMVAASEKCARIAREKLGAMVVRLRPPRTLARLSREALARSADGLLSAMRTALAGQRRVIGATAARLDSLSPLRVLERGYAVVVALKSGRVVVDAGSVLPGEDLELHLARGRLYARAMHGKV